jgi:hypothetical protein
MADKSKTIKNATDKELDDLLLRLRKESELQSLIADLKRKSTPIDPYNTGEAVSYSRPEVSTEQPIESLYHYGVLGMRWGVRRQRGPDGRVGSKQTAADDYKSARALNQKGVKNLSTKELQDLTKRLQLEKQYKELNPSEYKKGHEFVKGVLAAGTTITSLYVLSKTPMGQDVVAAIKKSRPPTP